MAEIMPVSECMSTNCAYSSIQVITQEPIGVLLIILIIVLFAALLPFALWPDDKLKRALQRFFVKHRINVFCYKLISWLKILEKRDPQTALITVRIYNFEQ
ncbi:MAG: hypothetical protein Q8O66_03100 [bacterium]|nr:hypothetical protein [bacterium]